MPRLQIRPWGPVGSGFEVVANSTITQGTAVFIVPREVAVRADSPHTDFKLRFAPSLLPGQPLHPDSISANRLEALTTQLAVLIVYERFYVPQSFWGPYWAMLPAEFPHIPTGEEGPRCVVAAGRPVSMERSLKPLRSRVVFHLVVGSVLCCAVLCCAVLCWAQLLGLGTCMATWRNPMLLGFHHHHHRHHHPCPSVLLSGLSVRTLLQLSSALVVAVNEANRKSNLAVQTVLRAAAHHPEVFGELTPATTAHLQQQAKWCVDEAFIWSPHNGDVIDMLVGDWFTFLVPDCNVLLLLLLPLFPLFAVVCCRCGTWYVVLYVVGPMPLPKRGATIPGVRVRGYSCDAPRCRCSECAPHTCAACALCFVWWVSDRVLCFTWSVALVGR